MRVLIWGDTPHAAWLVNRCHQRHVDVVTLAEPAAAPPALTDALNPRPDWIIFTMPAWAVGEAAFQLVQQLAPSQYPNILSLVGGIGGTEKLANYFGEERVVRGMMYKGELVLAEHVLHPQMAELVTLWDTSQFVDGQSLAWSEILYELPLNALPTLLDESPMAILSDKTLFKLEIQQIKEALRVIARLNISLIALPQANIPSLALAVRWLPPFLLRRFLRGFIKPSIFRAELEAQLGRSDAAYYHGAVFANGQNLGISTPVNHALAVSLTDIAEGRARWEQYRHNPDYLSTIIRIMARH